MGHSLIRSVMLIAIVAVFGGCADEVIPANPDVGVRIRDLTVGSPGPLDASVPLLDSSTIDDAVVDALPDPMDQFVEDQALPVDAEVTEPGKFGDPCEGNGDCESGICAGLGPNGENICVELCGDEGECPEGGRCERGFCVPGIADAGMPDEMDAEVEDAEVVDAEADMELELDLGEEDLGPELDLGVDIDGEVPGLDCMDLNACIMECGNEPACRRACRDEAAPGVRLSRAEMRNCIVENGCEGRGYHADLICGYRRCAQEMTACFGPNPVAMGRGTCGELLVCLDGCDAIPGECSDTCITDTAPEAYRTFSQIAACIEQSDCENGDVVCERQVCGPSIDRCILERVRPGALECTDILECVRRCLPENQMMCERQCLIQGTVEAVSSWNDFDACRRATECEDIEACEDACRPEANVCLGIEDPGPGDGERQDPNESCVDLHDCLGLCAGDLLCEVDCIGGATPEALEMFGAINDCVDLNQCSDLLGNLSRACFFENCNEQYLECFGDAGMPRGERDCAQFNDCLVACPDADRECLELCNESASPAAFVLYWAAIDCIDGSGCAAGDFPCQQNLCAREIQACIGVPEAGGICENTCVFANDGDCDDGGPNSDFAFCDLGSDCADCGPR